MAAFIACTSFDVYIYIHAYFHMRMHAQVENSAYINPVNEAAAEAAATLDDIEKKAALVNKAVSGERRKKQSR